MTISITIRNITLKRIIILCLTLFALSFSSEKNFFKFSKNIDNSLNLEFGLDNIEVESVGDYQKIKIDRFQLRH